jgi:hypothetical protein
MVDRSLNLITRQKSIRYVVFDSEVSTSDTLTFEDFSSITAFALFKLADGVAVTATKSTNVLTITSASLTNEKVVGIVIGIT